MRPFIKLHLAQFLLPFCLFLGAACNSNSAPNPPQAGESAAQGQIDGITVTGQAVFADGTPIVSQNVQYQIILDGANLFQAGINGCLPTPAHVAGITLQNAKSDEQGMYALSTPISNLHAAVVRQCSIQHLRTDQLEGITLRASILADANSCPSYCSAADDPTESCVQDCSSGHRTLIAAQSLNADLALKSLHSRTLEWNQTLIFNGLGPALTVGAGPDLTVDADAAKASAHVSTETFAADSCEVAESCVRAPGVRQVLRFDGTIQNVGSSDLVIGNPDTSGLFQKSSCHNVDLLKNIMLYELIDPTTGSVVNVDNQDVIGRKQGFCMMDITQLNASSPQGQYDCTNQGITAGWADIYDSDLECQFLDITHVPSGNYTLRLTVNPDGLFDESDSTNNTAEVPVTVP